eukprot:1903607-Rhodomonas_salina.1
MGSPSVFCTSIRRLTTTIPPRCACVSTRARSMIRANGPPADERRGGARDGGEGGKEIERKK